MMPRMYALAAFFLSLGLSFFLFLTPVHAEDGALSPERPPGQGLFNSSLWPARDSHFLELSPAWQRRYQELRSIAEDTDAIGLQLPLLLTELKRNFLKAQRSVVFLLLDLAPATMKAMDNYYLMCRLEEWEWYLADPVRYVSIVEQALAAYAVVLREVGDALARPRTADTPANAALLEVLPELRSMHALLEARVVHQEAAISPWLRPARSIMEQIRTALEGTRMVQPQLWVNYYTQPLRFTRLEWERKWLDLHDMGETLLRREIFPRPSILGAVVTLFILGGFALLFWVLEKQSSMAQTLGATPDISPKTSQGAPGGVLWQVLGALLHAQSPARKCALAVGAVCVANLFLDALPSVHVHMSFLTVQVCLLLLSVAVWARNSKADPPLALLLTPVGGGYLLLKGDAAPLWVLGGMIIMQFCCAIALSLRRQRSAFAQLWLGLLVLGLLFSVLGFARMVGLALGATLFCRVAFVVLHTLYHAKGLHDQPSRLCLVMPLMVAWLYSLGPVLGLCYTGADALWNYIQAEALQLFGITVQLHEVFVLLALGLGMLAFSSLSRQMLHRASRQRNVLDTSAVPVIHAVVNSLLWVLFLLFSLGVLGVDMRSLAFIGGALTVGIGLGLQSIISNFFSGLVIIFARMVRGGDFVEVGSVRGFVQNVNMRATVVETLEGATLLVPNVDMLNSRLINWTRNNRHVREDVVLHLPQNCDVDAAMRLMERVAATHKDIIPSPPPRGLVLKTGEGVVDIALQVWVEDVNRRRYILSDLQADLLQAFAREGISLALPCMTVMMTKESA